MKKELFKEEFFKEFGATSFKGYPLEQCNLIWNFFEPHLKLKASKPKIEIPQDKLITYNEMFPRLKGGSGKILQCNIKEVEKAFQWFIKNYPEYHWGIILEATRIYLAEQERGNYKWTRTSKYFCVKFKQPNQPESELAEFCARVVSGLDYEEPESYGFEPKIY